MNSFLIEIKYVYFKFILLSEIIDDIYLNIANESCTI